MLPLITIILINNNNNNNFNISVKNYRPRSIRIAIARIKRKLTTQLVILKTIHSGQKPLSKSLILITIQHRAKLQVEIVKIIAVAL